VFWSVIHKLVLLLSVIVFPVVFILEKIGIGIPHSLSNILEYCNSKYIKTHEFN